MLKEFRNFRGFFNHYNVGCKDMLSVVYISGATGGLGRSLAVECASRGWNLFLTDINEKRLEAFSKSLSHAYNVYVDYAACDMTDANARAELIDKVLEKKLCLSMMINVAGLDYEGKFLEKTRAQILTVLNVNVISTMDMIHSLSRFRDRSRTFRIINVCSLAGMFPMPVKATYAASKRFLIDMTLALREEFRPMNATLTGLCPAGMMTTEACIKGTEVQGFMGRITTLEVSHIARKTIDHALKGKAIYIPGFVNQLLTGIGRLLPSSTIASIIGKRWEKTNKEVEEAIAIKRVPNTSRSL